MADIQYQPIGLVHSRYQTVAGMPIQPTSASALPGTLEILPKFAPGLKDLGGFSHIIVLYHFHRVREPKLLVTPFLDSQPHGVFATRAPTRPNPIGLSIVKLLRVRRNILEIANLDILDGTPVLDIKPYVPEFDQPSTPRVGWLKQATRKIRTQKSDARFQPSKTKNQQPRRPKP